jgi:predicted ferric reductase
MFWHCGNEGNSWYYLYASVAVFVVSLLGRLFLKTSSIFGMRWFQRNTATVQALGPSMVKVSVFTKSNWKPGEHAFLRFPTIRTFANHPFTIASIPDPKSTEHQEMVFLVRPYQGFSAILHSMAVASPSSELSLSVDVGGPYGGQGRAIERRYDSVVLVAGGGGISSVLPELLHLTRVLGTEKSVTQEVVLIWAVQHEDALEWVREQLIQAVEVAPEGSLTLKTFVTQSQEVVEKHVVTNEKSLDFGTKPVISDLWTTDHRRPNLLKLIPTLMTLPRTVVLGTLQSPPCLMVH